jgi:cytochrome b subunit of formate dehydrogenase
MSHDIREAENRVVRHSGLEMAEHWAIALSGLVLLMSGMFELPTAARYRINALPGLAWSGDFITSLYVHYAASLVFIAAACFHLAYHGLRGEIGLLPKQGDVRASIAVIKTFFGKEEEPPFGKYLPEQRLAYLGMAVIIAVLILSGLVKTYKNVFAPDLDYTLVLWATWLHNAFFVLFILAFVAHIGALLLRPNWPMIRGIFTGTVRLDYARRRHPLWMATLEPPPAPGPPEAVPGSTPESVAAETEADLTPIPPEGEEAPPADEPDGAART